VPTYGYECTRCGAQFEVFQSITEQPLSVHDGCGGAVRRLVYPVGIVFKGPGFHVNDYPSKRNGKDGKNGKGETSSESSSETKTPAAASSSKE